MKLRLLIILALGAGLTVYLIGHIGFAAVFSAALAIGWGGFAIFCAYTLALYVLLGTAWHLLVARARFGQLKTFIWSRMVRDSAAELLPLSQVGGFVIGARATILGGLTPSVAAASTVVDVTAEMLAQIAYVALGLALLAEHAPQTSFTASLIRGLIIGLVVVGTGGGIFLFLQRRGMWITERLAPRWLPQALLGATAFATALEAIHKTPLRVTASAGTHFAGWIASALSTWIALRLMGVQAEVGTIIALESLICAMRSVGFAVPSALGVQEAAYAVLAPLLGLGPEIGLAISLLRRARDIAIGVPVLLSWQAMEGRHALALQTANGKYLKS